MHFNRFSGNYGGIDIIYRLKPTFCVFYNKITSFMIQSTHLRWKNDWDDKHTSCEEPGEASVYLKGGRIKREEGHCGDKEGDHLASRQ